MGKLWSGCDKSAMSGMGIVNTNAARHECMAIRAVQNKTQTHGSSYNKKEGSYKNRLFVWSGCKRKSNLTNRYKSFKS